VPWIYKEPKNTIEKKALAEIEAIKQRRDDKLQKARVDEEKKKTKEEKRKKDLREELTKMKIELGVLKNVDSN
jgi:hypothetical protein